jgi:hypothetical protein
VESFVRGTPSAAPHAAITSVTPATVAKGVRIKKVLDTLAGPVSGDPARLQQVVWNLLTNAVKFTPKGGRVQVLLERVNSHIEISVIDTGVGISPEYLPHIFERFSQADSKTTRRHGGLGLAIVKQLIELHGGSVRAKSPGEGQGSTFVVSLPITVVHEAPQELTRPKEHEANELDCSEKLLSDIRVLVVDGATPRVSRLATLAPFRRWPAVPLLDGRAEQPPYQSRYAHGECAPEGHPEGTPPHDRAPNARGHRA